MLDRGVYHHHKSRRWMGAMSLEAGQARSLVQRPRWEWKAESGGICGEREELGWRRSGGWVEERRDCWAVEGRGERSSMSLGTLAGD